MRAIKIQTKAGRKMSETGIIPAFFHIGNFWTMDHKPLFERINIDSDGLDNLPDGTILRVDRDVRYPNSLYFRKEPSNTGGPWAKPTTTSTMSSLVFLASGLASSMHLSS